MTLLAAIAARSAQLGGSGRIAPSVCSWPCSARLLNRRSRRSSSTLRAFARAPALHDRPPIASAIWTQLHGTKQVGEAVAEVRRGLKDEFESVEQRHQQYPMTIAFLGLFRELLAGFRVGGLGEPEGARAYVEWIADDLFAHFDSFGFREGREGQKWELAAGCLAIFVQIIHGYDPATCTAQEGSDGEDSVQEARWIVRTRVEQAALDLHRAHQPRPPSYRCPSGDAPRLRAALHIRAPVPYHKHGSSARLQPPRLCNAQRNQGRQRHRRNPRTGPVWRRGRS